MIGPDLGRIEKAREERRKQLLRWDEYDRDYQNSLSAKRRKKNSKRVEFGTDVVFLEAASRSDINEGKIINAFILFIHLIPYKAEILLFINFFVIY